MPEFVVILSVPLTIAVMAVTFVLAAGSAEDVTALQTGAAAGSGREDL